jgi:predicted O-methyltransferase YrrM
MYSRFQLAKKYLHYYIHAANGKGHGVHSPFVFDFIINVLGDKKHYRAYEQTETLRKRLRADNTTIEVADFGAGSGSVKTTGRKINRIASSSLKPKKYAQLLFRIAQYYRAQQIVELGTSLGVTTAYLASAGSAVHTLEGAPAIAHIAKQNFAALGLQNITLLEGPFEETLPVLLSKGSRTDMVFIDGNHRKAPTLDYFRQLLPLSTPATIFIFDDIHWSRGMEEAWDEIKQHPAVTLTIDLFFIGIVLFREDFKVKQHFSIRF